MSESFTSMLLVLQYLATSTRVATDLELRWNGWHGDSKLMPPGFSQKVEAFVAERGFALFSGVRAISWNLA